ncbi:MAG: hypothetical protein LUE27_06855 [Clostridia bacterium]|nr:hypothetical protein [Clostridia bacterium]
MDKETIFSEFDTADLEIIRAALADHYAVIKRKKPEPYERMVEDLIDAAGKAYYDRWLKYEDAQE